MTGNPSIAGKEAFADHRELFPFLKHRAFPIPIGETSYYKADQD